MVLRRDVARPALSLLLLVLCVPALAVLDTQSPVFRALPACGVQGELMLVAGDLPSCVHSDDPPPGVDVTEPVSTAELKQREGAGPAAFDAAQDLGVPSVNVATNVADPAVPCDGDGTSGYRIQPMYVVEATKTNRYADLLASFRLWAAGTDDVVNRSAALTGGVRHLRYVTEAGGGGTCVAKVLNVTVPAGANASFGSTISAVQALGYTDPTRKYLMWTDATVLCGVANMYPNDADTQGNPNNGSYAQYARVDAGCWGWGDGANQHSVEAHEILHALGGVMSTAPHGTRAGHCYDESDTMCYADGGGFAMQQICPTNREYFFDCNNDDYFSTYPDPGGYLDTHWNAADSRFLIGGGNGSGGGTAGTPTVLGATISVNNPAVPGLPTQVSVTPSIPSGRTLTSVAWKSGRADCVFGTPTQAQSTVTCNATSSTATTVTATLVDSSGATKVVSSPLTFATGGARAVSVQLSVDSQTASPASVCTSAPFPVKATVIDNASGQPVKGLSVTLTKQTATMTAPASAGSGVSTVAGTVTASPSALVTTSFAAKTTATAVYAVGTSSTISAVPAKCSPVVTATADKSATYYADPVTVSGSLTRSVSGNTVPVVGASVGIRLTTVNAGITKVTTLTTVKTTATGTYSAIVKPTASGALSAAVTASTAYNATSDDAGAIAVSVPATDLTASLDKDDVGYGGTVTVTGTLERVAGNTVTPLSGSTVSVVVTAPGKAPVTVASGRTSTSGAYTVPVSLKVSGAMVLKYAGAAGQPAAQVALGDVVAGTWSTALTANASASGGVYGAAVTVTGTLTRSYGGLTEGAKGLVVKVMFKANGSTTSTQVASATTGVGGAYTTKVYVRSTGTYTVTFAAAGYASASASPFTLTMV